MQRKSNHNDNPAEVLCTEYRMEALKSDSIANTQKGPRNTGMNLSKQKGEKIDLNKNKENLRKREKIEYFYFENINFYICTKC